MKKTLFTLAILALLTSCNSGSKKTSEDTASKQLTLTELTGAYADYENQEITVEGMVTHVCKHGGQKMFLTDTVQDVSLLIRVSASIPEFDVALEGSTVQVSGKLIGAIAAASEEEHEGEHADGEHAEPSNCPTEEAMKDTTKTTGTPQMEYYLEAFSFKEI